MAYPHLKPINAAEARALVAEGAVVYDVREAMEFRMGHIPGSRNQPLSRLFDGEQPDPQKPIIFSCLSGARTTNAAMHLARFAGRDAYVLSGGLNAWRSAGLPVTR